MPSSQYLSEMFGLSGQTAIMTGATGGLGLAIATGLVQAGVKLVVSIELPDDPLSAQLKENVEKLGGSVESKACDLRDKTSIRACFKSIWDSGVEPDILVNCAGVMRRNLCENVTDDEIDLIIDVNMKSFYVSTQEFGRQLIALNRPGKVINIASVTSFNAGFNTSVYSSTKGAVLQMTRAFSNEWASKGIQVNCICPGFMQTPMTEKYREDPKMTDYIMVRVPMMRWGQPQDLVSAALFLAAPGNTFTSGAALVVDGGFCGK